MEKLDRCYFSINEIAFINIWKLVLVTLLCGLCHFCYLFSIGLRNVALAISWKKKHTYFTSVNIHFISSNENVCSGLCWLQ